MDQNQYKIYLEFGDSNWHAYWDMSISHIKESQPFFAWSIYEDEVWGEFHYAPLKRSLEDDKFSEKIKEVNEKITDADVEVLRCAARVFLKSVESAYP